MGYPAIWERVRAARFEPQLPYVATEEVVDTYSGTLFIGGAIPPGVFTLSGKVTDSTTAQPIAGVTVTIDTRQIATAQDGSYSFGDLQAKTYQVVFAKTGYQSITKTVTITKDTVLNIQMTPVGVPPPEEKKKFPWWILGVAGGALVVVAVAATAKKKK